MASGVDTFLTRYRACEGGYYREFAPPADLRRFVACNWVSVVRQDHGEVPVVVIPDGCVDVMTFDDEPPHVAGPDTFTRLAALADGTVITGVRLRPGAARAVLGCRADELLNAGARLLDLDRRSHRLTQDLQRTGDLTARYGLLEDWVRSALTRAGSRDEAVIHASRALAANPRMEIGVLASELGWNARMVHREFVAACGYGPKYLQRILRVQGALRMAHTAPNMRLADIAATVGFADQAHMNRDFCSITGFTPATYLAASSPEFGRWLSEDWAEAPGGP